MEEPFRACAIRRDIDVYYARSTVRRFAEWAGASRREAAELEIVASELAWNIVRHVGSGWMKVALGVASNDGVALTITATDPGPLLDLDSVTVDGWSRNGMLLPEQCFGRSGIGCGLGAVRRLTDRLEQIPENEGKSIVATRSLKGRILLRR